MKTAQFEVRKDQLGETQVVENALFAIGDGQILCRIDRFALTANNITYGVVGEKIGYWQFFPATDGWGVIPVWGFADVVESRHADITLGERLYGYFPMASHIVLQPDKVTEQRLLDAMPHRRKLPPVYNSYARTGGEPFYDATMDDERMLLFPLYATSFCLYDYFKDNDYFGASQIIVPSASSKTAIGLAYALHADADSPATVGVTSAGNAEAVSELALYDDVCTYNNVTDIDEQRPSVIIDMSGNGSVLSALHEHLGDNMRFTSNVGLTHLDDNEMGPAFIRERSEMFFAPGHIQKRAADWGAGVFEGKAMKFWHDAATKSRSWLTFEHHAGMDALADVYQQVLAGRVPPTRGVIASL